MRFSKLRLTGFKSFVDPTDLVISDGLTGVVGPNGCGKSNLLEALRWVMGENRAKSMRGDGMEDVIFAGAATRPARNFAEVALTLDNQDRLAPAGFNDTDVLEITRRITRDVGSAYKVSGKDVRARDVQMLFADAATGAHSPALVRQGQISELINAKPKNRRKVLEDAAGIGGLYQRRHEAELKLKSTEANLTRVDDVLEQLAAQLTQLEKQARQAARYRAIGAELRQSEGLLLYRRWREADEARAEADDALKTHVTEAAQAEAAARKAEAAREEAEKHLPPLREEEAVAAAILQRLIVQRDTLEDEERRAEELIETLTARLEQLTRDIDREAGLNRDAGETISRLEREAQDLEEASAGHDDALATAEEAATTANRALETGEADLTQKTEDVARLAARHQSAQRYLDDLTKTLERSGSEAERARGALEEARTKQGQAKADLDNAHTALNAAQTMSERAETVLQEAENARAEAQTREADARAARSASEGELSALQAETDALGKLLRRDTADGQVLDLIQVAEGLEKALGAALADDLRAPLISDDGSGWAQLPDYASDAPLPEGAAPLAAQVNAPAELNRRLAQIGLVEAADGARLQADLRPGQRLVSREGDLWRWDGFRARAEDAPTAAALRMEQLNRLEALKREVTEVTAQSQAARDAHDQLATRLKELAEADRAARDARREADAALTDATRKLNRAEADLNMADARVENLERALARHEEDAAEAKSQFAEAEAAQEDLGDLDAARAGAEVVRQAVEAARSEMMSKRSALDALRRTGEARKARAGHVARELGTWRDRLGTAEARATELATRRTETEANLSEARDAPQALSAKRSELSGAVTAAEARKASAADALSVAENGLRAAISEERDAERSAGEARETRARTEARSEAARETVAQAVERIRDALETTPQDLLTQLDTDPDQMPPADKIEADVSRLKRQRDALGAVNLRAEEDAQEVQTEYDELLSEKTDLEEAVATLRSGINNLNREGRERLLTAFEQVNENFTMLFKHLFGGGEANLVMVESDDPLEAGLEIMCQPPGKKLSTLSLLSGGEQTLTALALIFAVFLANPSPICVLDEVDAPLDDANVTRFCDMLDEMCRRTETRFLIITHHAVTMARMDRLFGVTMQEQGVSQLVSVDLKNAEKMVA